MGFMQKNKLWVIIYALTLGSCLVAYAVHTIVTHQENSAHPISNAIRKWEHPFLDTPNELEFRFIGSSWFDYELYYGRGRGLRPTEYQHMWFEQINDEHHFQEWSERFGFTLDADVDFSEDSLFVSFCREVLDMAYGHDPWRDWDFLALAFSEYYIVDTAYFYTSEKINLFTPAFIYAHCYIMRDDMRIYVSETIDGMIMTPDEQEALFIKWNSDES